MITPSHGERMHIGTSSFRVQLNSTSWSVPPTTRHGGDSGCILNSGLESEDIPANFDKEPNHGTDHRKVASGLRTRKDEPPSAHQESKHSGGGSGRDGVGGPGRGHAARGPLRQPHLLSDERQQEG